MIPGLANQPGDSSLEDEYAELLEALDEDDKEQAKYPHLQLDQLLPVHFFRPGPQTITPGKVQAWSLELATSSSSLDSDFAQLLGREPNKIKRVVNTMQVSIEPSTQISIEPFWVVHPDQSEYFLIVDGAIRACIMQGADELHWRLVGRNVTGTCGQLKLAKELARYALMACTRITDDINGDTKDKEKGNG